MKIIKAEQGDIPAIARIHVEGWKGAYGGIIDQAHLDGITIEERAAQWKEWLPNNTTLLACQDDKPIGFIAFGKVQTPPPGTSSIRPLYTSEIYGLYLLPEYYRQGIGRALMQAACTTLLEQKHKSMCLWVLDKNDRGKGFYEAMGGQRIGKHMIEIGPTKAKEICYGWRDITPVSSAL